MKILMTGGAGYIGSILVPELLRSGHEVAVIDNFMYQQTSLLGCCHDKKLTVVRGDARDKDLILKYIKTADAIFPLACLTGATLCEKDPLAARTIILEAIKMILESRSQDQIIIYPTTNSGYGVGQKDKFCTEETPLKPISLYGRLKVEAEKAILDAGNAITLRLATAFGISPRMRLDLLVNDFVYRAVNDHFIVLFESHFKRNFIHVRDVAQAFIHALDKFEALKNESYNVGLSDANLSKKELCEEIKRQIPDFYFAEEALGRDPDQRNYIVSNEKIEATGFKPQIPLPEGIQELIRGYQIIKRNKFTNV
ncbi:NAD-dependent epimerase/dehydratase family protein [Candidatus Margulisiibacteriota bacterium]